MEEIFALKRILRCFQLVSRLKINIFKSMLVGVVCAEDIVHTLADLVHCKVGRLPISYLGLPIGMKPRSQALWDLLIGKIEKRLSSWKK